MEPLARRPLDKTPMRRPILDGVVRPIPPRQTAPNSATPPPIPQPTAKPAPLKPVAAPVNGPTIDIRPTHHSPSAQPITPHQHTVSPAQPQQKYAVPDRPHATTQAANLNIKPHKQHKSSHSAHASLVGFIIFLIVSTLCLTPILPGKTWQTAPGSTDSFSTGDQSLDCLGTLGSVTTTVHTDHKIGFPITYSHATTTQQSATCENKTIRAVAGHTAQINPLGLLIDLVLPLVVAIAAAKIWHKVRSAKD